MKIKRNFRNTEWHTHFCLLPRMVEDKWVWLESVERIWMEPYVNSVDDFALYGHYIYKLKDE